MAIYDANGNQLTACYDASGNVLQNAYDASGNVIFTSNAHVISNSFTKTLLCDLSEISAGTQGLASDGLSQTLAQMYSGKVALIDVSDCSYTMTSSLNMIHSGSAQFKPTKENVSDEYPHLWVSSTANYNYMYDTDNMCAFLFEVEITSSTLSRYKTIVAPIPNGYQDSGFAIDFANQIAYHVISDAYSGGTTTIVRIYNMTDLIVAQGDYSSPNLEGDNGTYEFNTIVETYTIDYVTNNQSVTFFDGMIVLLSDGSSKYIRFIDVETHEVVLDITDLPAGENEGVTFMLDADGMQYDMYVCSRGQASAGAFNTYYKYVFNL